MPSTNRHDEARRVVLYARVSTEEQVKGYSLAQQLEALRGYAASEGYEVLDEVVDPGYMGASLVRPGMDRVRDLVEEGGVHLVLAQDADRITREPHHRALLDDEFAAQGCALRALDDWGDDSHEGQLLKFMKGWVSKGERLKTAERTRRGLTRKVREGKIIKGPKPNFGFRFNESGDGLVVYELEMRLVERIFRMAAEEGLGPKAIQTRLYREGVPSPTGKPWWPHRIIKHQILLNDLYRPHPFQEIAALVSSEAAAGLDHNDLYGIWWWNRRAVTKRHDSEPDASGGRRYRARTTTRTRDREEWMAVPVRVGGRLTRDLVDRARQMIGSRTGNERKHRTRQWELKNLMRCSCGQSMILNTSRAAGREPYFYYRCKREAAYGRDACSQRSIRAERVEAPVWDFVSGMLTEPGRLRRGLARMREEDTSGAAAADLGRETREVEAELEEVARLRRAYQDQQASGLMTLEELRARLAEIEGSRAAAEARLAALRRSLRRSDDLEVDGEAALAALAERVPEDLAALTGEERNALYRMLRLEVVPDAEGLQVTGVLLPPETHSCG